jgi:hypothetical protein
MSKEKTLWIPTYKCQLCGELVDGYGEYNQYGARHFPDVDAPQAIRHACRNGDIGLAALAGLTERRMK